MSGHRFGPRLDAEGATFALWAPAAKAVDLVLDAPHVMTPHAGGWFTLRVPGAVAGTLYRFRIDGELEIPDPASHFQPHDVSGPSEVIDHGAFAWHAADWRGRPWHEAVFLEAHVGAFTPQGTYRAMTDRLDHLVAAGITALELMPLADFPGRRNWGYDGVLWYAPDHIYGRPEDLKTLIDAAHSRGLMVFLDVVYNHFGPEGNYLGRLAPAFFCHAKTPWGDAIDYRVGEARRFAIDSALHWLDHYRFDGLRLDAVHAITEPGAPHLLRELSAAAGDLARRTKRRIHLVLENDDNLASLLDPREEPPAGHYRAQWNDDYHHAWHVLLTGERAGYYADYPAPQQALARMLRAGFAYQGEASAHRGGAARGETTHHLPPTAFVNFLQNHDQIGNRALGDRLAACAEPAAIEAALAITLLAPMPPLLFMGEEWGAASPFPFFCDFGGELADAVRAGRRREFSAAYAAHGDAVPDPLDETTFRAAQLDWSKLEEPHHRARLMLVRELLAVRHAEIVPRLAGCSFGDAHLAGDVLTAQWQLGDGSTLHLTANLSERDASSEEPVGGARRLWGEDAGGTLAPWAVRWSLETR